MEEQLVTKRVYLSVLSSNFKSVLLLSISSDREIPYLLLYAIYLCSLSIYLLSSLDR